MATGVSVNPAPIGPPPAMYPGPPHQTYPPPTMSSIPPRLPSHSNPPHALRRSMDLDQEPSPVQPARQSLPSIHEALGNDNPLPYPGPSPSGPPSHPHSALSRPSTEGPAGPPNPFSSVGTSNPAPYLREPQYNSQQGSAAAADQQRISMVSLSTQDSRKQSLQSLSGKSPTSSSKTAPTSISSPNSYGSYPSQPYPWPSQPPAPYDSRAYNGGPWKPNLEVMRNDEKTGILGSRPGMALSQPHGDSVKRQFDSYDVESSLAEIIDGSTKTLDFSRHYASIAHQNQRSGPILGTLPSLHELDDLIQQQQRNHEALLRIRNAVVSQEHALAEQRIQQRHGKVENGYDDEHSGLYPDGFKSPGGFNGGDAKKRRGKAAPPGRCHSCNRAETPEWRRGPDGARTLCNACGLHYAKLTRKMGQNKAAALSSTLKPKSLDPSSPVHR
ncbi:GATA-type sexual development transcription factor NsdD [Talaromyces stipitatus ATCC 10500]|uniref:GATA-type sexual development transcription factor NsdD n=1 Tax=Talaromyces stipitatus (strain ATCC 10500 / CBS 375.48 / QM 6759 / NRRL 1006) TaxID=441959 RepID=B8M4X2_TALSN|nr:GATA-type sexual development transcription factor NsdD [Talaromyces stipitatus ATCC 10500]EED19407.1 GATA-type sexual development transcription factor NsdD [Talaromyces stipitatus ATCC 10500]